MGIASKNKLGSFREAFELVENGISKNEYTISEDSKARKGYEHKFISMMKGAMIGLLEPQDNLLDHFGREKTIQDIEKLCNTYRELLEKIIPKYTYYFHRDFFEDEF